DQITPLSRGERSTHRSVRLVELRYPPLRRVRGRRNERVLSVVLLSGERSLRRGRGFPKRWADQRYRSLFPSHQMGRKWTGAGFGGCLYAAERYWEYDTDLRGAQSDCLSGWSQDQCEQLQLH